MADDLYIGLLSGTSVDAVDAALVRFSPAPELVASHGLGFPDELRAELLALCVPGENEIDRLGRADVAVGRWFARAVNELLRKAQVQPSAIRGIGSHGQTIRHRPTLTPAFTLQIGDPNVIAADTGIPVVADFRRKDMALGGQGAPLVPAFHDAIFRAPGQDRVILNIGGIANVTILPGDATASVAGFDTGPGNTLLDRWVRRVRQQAFDEGGALAARGTVEAALLRTLLADRFFSTPPPKSTGPEYFSMRWLEAQLAGVAGERTGASWEADVQATLVELTAASIFKAVADFTTLRQPAVFVCGGGAHNPALMRALQARFGGERVRTTEALGVPVDWVESIAFAWLARQRLERLPGNCPRVTGASRPAVLGGVYLPD